MSKFEKKIIFTLFKKVGEREISHNIHTKQITTIGTTSTSTETTSSSTPTASTATPSMLTTTVAITNKLLSENCSLSRESKYAAIFFSFYRIFVDKVFDPLSTTLCKTLSRMGV